MSECSHADIVQPNKVAGPKVGPELLPTDAAAAQFGACDAQ
jgi:hypothetical protein